MLCGRMSLFPKLGTTGMESPCLSENVSANLSASRRLVLRTCAGERGMFSSESWRALSPVQTTKSMSSRMLAVIQSKVALRSEMGASQSEVSAP